MVHIEQEMRQISFILWGESGHDAGRRRFCGVDLVCVPASLDLLGLEFSNLLTVKLSALGWGIHLAPGLYAMPNTQLLALEGKQEFWGGCEVLGREVRDQFGVNYEFAVHRLGDVFARLSETSPSSEEVDALELLQLLVAVVGVVEDLPDRLSQHIRGLLVHVNHFIIAKLNGSKRPEVPPLRLSIQNFGKSSAKLHKNIQLNQ